LQSVIPFLLKKCIDIIFFSSTSEKLEV
jgi:hypothetical protein